ncbi:hypothetical protein WS68_23575 [Burkholderia sp. TSV86]|nr:hypothetical protein WS68_23575 [Burkholderia sp. TSV86]
MREGAFTAAIMAASVDAKRGNWPRRKRATEIGARSGECGRTDVTLTSLDRAGQKDIAFMRCNAPSELREYSAQDELRCIFLRPACIATCQPQYDRIADHGMISVPMPDGRAAQSRR